MRKINKKGQTMSEGLFLFWRIGLVAAAIIVITVSMAQIFSAKQDVRPSEAALLSKSFVECISRDGIVQPNFDLRNCGSYSETEYFVNVSIASLESEFNTAKTFGNPSLITGCEIVREGVTYTRAPVCTSQKYYLLIQNNGKVEGGILTITSSVRKADSNV